MYLDTLLLYCTQLTCCFDKQRQPSQVYLIDRKLALKAW
jgi:hypothetical protein